MAEKRTWFLRAGLVFFCLLFLMLGCTSQPASTVAQTTSALPRPTSPPEEIIPTEDTAFLKAREAMVETIRDYGVENPDVIRAMQDVPRHRFVPDTYLSQAYEDHPLPIGYGQTISQPFIVAWMTELLELKPGEKVLEIGTGSGYQAAVLAELGYVDVYSIEIVPELAESAAANLKSQGFQEVHVKQGDGYYGWEEFAPFDAIIVTAAPDHLPAPLAAQLVDGGRIVIPIGPPGGYQSLWKFVKQTGELKAFNLGGVMFVPFTGAGVENVESSPMP